MPARLQNFLFNRKLLQKAIERHLDLAQIEHLQQKRATLKNWQQAIASKTFKRTGEVALHGDFLIDIFGQVLGYHRQIEHPTEWHLTHEQKTLLDATKSDGALGFFTPDSQDIRAIIELKSLRTDLDAKQHRKNDKRSPVEQAFGYVHKAGGKCHWVIVSNYHEVRLYHASFSGKYEVFHLTELINETEFLRFYYLLASQHLFSKTSESLVEALFRQSVESEKAITGQFYAQYTQARRDLFEHLKQQNPDRCELTLLTHTQQLLDRFIFICFCEDTGDLLPEKTFRKLIQRTQESVASTYEHGTQKIWRELKAFFRAMNEGLNSHQIPSFNGELFKPDPAFDTLRIEDAIFLRLAHLTEYDFQSELNVNILGHIFEQSLTDLEELRAEIRGEQRDRKQSKRKKEGIFYTPESITRYIVEHAIGGWLEDRQHELGRESLPELTSEDEEWLTSPAKKKKLHARVEQHIVFWEAYLECLKRITVLDPACGSGAFLTQAFDYLLREGERVNHALNRLRPGEQLGLFSRKTWDKAILRNNLFGVDLNPESVEITKLALWLKTAKKNDQLTALNHNIKCGNSLIDDPSIDGEKAFLWTEEFPEIMKNGGFDVIVGNPPYITYHGRRRVLIPLAMLTYYKAYYNCVLDKSVDGKYNSAMFFIEMFVRLSKKSGYIGCITDISFYEHFYKGVKKYLLDHTEIKYIVNGLSSFENVGSGQLILIAKKVDRPPKSHIVNWFVDGLNGKETNVDQSLWNNPRRDFQFYIEASDMSKHILAKCQLNTHPLEFYFPYKLIRTGESIGVKEQGFVITEYPATPDDVEIYEYLEGANSVGFRYATPIPTRYFRFDIELLNRRNLEYRREAQEHHRKNPKVLGIGDKKAFDNPKILIRQSCDHFCCTYTKEKYVYNRSYYSISNENSSGKSETNLFYILGVLNSKLLTYYARQKRIIRMEHGKQPQIRLNDLKQVPIYFLSLQEQQVFIDHAKKILKLHERLYQDAYKFFCFIETRYHLSKISTKIKEFYLFTFNDFLLELQKQKVVLSAKDEFELMGLFEEQRAHLRDSKKMVDETDKEIDSMIYQLYGLTEEEIGCIESST